MLFVRQLKAFGVKKGLDRFAESNLVLLDIRKFFGGIPHKLHAINLP